jgi:hypothetical protein
VSVFNDYFFFFKDEGEYDENAELGEGEQADDHPVEKATTTTTTEKPKVVGPSIRPFRSNNDLLKALQKKRIEMKANKKETGEFSKEF